MPTRLEYEAAFRAGWEGRKRQSHGAPEVACPHPTGSMIYNAWTCGFQCRITEELAAGLGLPIRASWDDHPSSAP